MRKLTPFLRINDQGLEVAAFIGGPLFAFTEAIFRSVDRRDQKEIDRLWRRLSNGGRTQRRGRLKDRHGLSWQIVPSVLSKLLSDPDPGRSERAWRAMLKMRKLDIAALGRAHGGTSRPRPVGRRRGDDGDRGPTARPTSEPRKKNAAPRI